MRILHKSRRSQMSRYLAPGNRGFERALNADFYVDKSGLLNYLNDWINTDHGFVCVTRPRRFGKSVALSMIDAYYDKWCDSHALFDQLEIAKSPVYEKHINKYEVIRIDALEERDTVQDPMGFVPMLVHRIMTELHREWPEIIDGSIESLSMALQKIHENTGALFVITIDEWDCIFRIDHNQPKAQLRWVHFLRSIFKGSQASEYIALAYITGMMPIKKYEYEIESSLSIFKEYSVLNTYPLDRFFGFTEMEVRELCNKYQFDYTKLKRWFLGYKLTPSLTVYNPIDIIESIRRNTVDNYWTQAGSFNALLNVFSMRFDGLPKAIIRLAAGDSFPINTLVCDNTLNYKCRDDLLTSLIHQGYLTYDKTTRTAAIPNYEIQTVFTSAITFSKCQEVIQALQLSESFLHALEARNPVAAKAAIQAIFDNIVEILNSPEDNAPYCAMLYAIYNARLFYTIDVHTSMLPLCKTFILTPDIESTFPAIVIECYMRPNDGDISCEHNEREYLTAIKSTSKRPIILTTIQYCEESKSFACAIDVL